jgi:hypothetical protein
MSHYNRCDYVKTLEDDVNKGLSVKKLMISNPLALSDDVVIHCKKSLTFHATSVATS